MYEATKGCTNHRCGATAIIFIPISKLRSLSVEDNFNNTFNKNAFPFVHSTMVKHCKSNKGVLFNQVICGKNFLISLLVLVMQIVSDFC